MNTRRGFLGGLAGIFAAGFAPAAIGSGVLMPVRQSILKPSEFYDGAQWTREQIASFWRGPGVDEPLASLTKLSIDMLKDLAAQVNAGKSGFLDDWTVGPGSILVRGQLNRMPNPSGRIVIK